MTHARALAVPLLLAALAACQPHPATLSPAPAPRAPAPTAGERAALAAALDSIFADSAFGGAWWGVEVRSLDTGETLYRRNGEKMFVPASNMKLVTAAPRWRRWAPGTATAPRVAATGPVAGRRAARRPGGIRQRRPHHRRRFGNGDARGFFRAWADSLRAHGVTRITGSIVGNDDVFDDVPLGRGWAWDDLDAYVLGRDRRAADERGVRHRPRGAGARARRADDRPRLTRRRRT
jgi:D-alanyl-D-alanine carboxypeptidase/D-alanyl-D-alanine-endopeptidase (penicillin-binding protein 4)